MSLRIYQKSFIASRKVLSRTSLPRKRQRQPEATLKLNARRKDSEMAVSDEEEEEEEMWLLPPFFCQ